MNEIKKSKVFVKPEIEVIYLTEEDIITLSGGEDYEGEIIPVHKVGKV